MTKRSTLAVFTEQKTVGQEIHMEVCRSMRSLLEDSLRKRALRSELKPSQPMNDVGYSLLIC